MKWCELRAVIGLAITHEGGRGAGSTPAPRQPLVDARRAYFWGSKGVTPWSDENRPNIDAFLKNKQQGLYTGAATMELLASFSNTPEVSCLN